MTRFKILSALLLIGALSACAGPDLSKEHDFDEWVGKSKTEVIAKFGQPSLLKTAPDGSEQLFYATGHHTSHQPYGSKSGSIHHQCNYRFVTDSGAVVRHAFRTGVCRYEQK
ncbi:MAG: hypothetical protein KG075_19180 [Alphaproteobacteria bacterium]|nr:hypothetical protein [Alphaproteobacteria bacterium]